MAAEITISEVTVRIVPSDSLEFIGYASCLVNGCLRLDNMKVVRRPNGTLRLECPRPRGKRQFHYYPTNADARHVLENAVSQHVERLAALANGGR